MLFIAKVLSDKLVKLFPQDVKIASMNLKVCYLDGGCSECDSQTEAKQCSGAFLQTKKSKELVS